MAGLNLPKSAKDVSKDVSNTDPKDVKQAGELDPTVQSAEDVGLDTPVEKNPVEEVLAAAHAATHGGATSDEGHTTFTSHPVLRFAVGPYQFENGLLRLKGADLKTFEELLKALPAGDARIVSKLDTSKVDQIVKERAAATQQFDSSVGRDALQDLQKEFPRVGTAIIGEGRTGHAAPSQTDGNVEVAVNSDGSVAEPVQQ